MGNCNWSCISSDPLPSPCFAERKTFEFPSKNVQNTNSRASSYAPVSLKQKNRKAPLGISIPRESFQNQYKTPTFGQLKEAISLYPSHISQEDEETGKKYGCHVGSMADTVRNLESSKNIPDGAKKQD